MRVSAISEEICEPNPSKIGYISVEEGVALNKAVTVAGDYVFAGAGSREDESGSLYAVDRHSGDELWVHETAGQVRNVPTVADGIIYFRTADDDADRVHALAIDTQEELWTIDAGGGGPSARSAPTVADGVVYFGGGGELFGVDAETGEEVWYYDWPESEMTTFSAPVVDDGTLYVGAAGAVRALDAHGEGSSTDTRVNLGTLGHHDGWSGDSTAILGYLDSVVEGDYGGSDGSDDTTGGADPSGDDTAGGTDPSGDDVGDADDDGAGFGVGGAVAALAGAGYLVQRWLASEDSVSDS